MALYGSDREVLQQLLQWSRQGHRLALVTVIRTWGSSPRPLGSLLVMRDDGRFAGSVSGGCVEEDLVGRYARGELSEQLPTRVGYGVDRADAARHGLPCGGRLELLVEAVADLEEFAPLLDAIQQQRLVMRRLDMNTGESRCAPADPREESFFCDGTTLGKVYGPAWHMLLIGAGELARYVASMALMLDYQVTVCDPREETTAGWSLDGVALSRGMPDDVVREIANHPCCVVLTLAHDPKVDDMALMEALLSPAFYVGALGSRPTSESRRQRLASLGLTPAALDRLHAPVGLAIGSRTPAEIAVSIIAGVTAARRTLAARPR